MRENEIWYVSAGDVLNALKSAVLPEASTAYFIEKTNTGLLRFIRQNGERQQSRKGVYGS